MKTLVISMHPTPASSRMGKRVQELLKKQYNADVHEITSVISLQHAQLTSKEVEAEHELLLKYDRFIFLSPLQWMTISALGALWFEQVFVDSFVYASSTGPSPLANKHTMFIFTSGAEENYFAYNGAYDTIESLATPLKVAVAYCSLKYEGAFNFAPDSDFDGVMKQIAAKVPK